MTTLVACQHAKLHNHSRAETDTAIHTYLQARDRELTQPSCLPRSVAILVRPHLDRLQSRGTTLPDRVCLQGHHHVRTHLARHPRGRRLGRHHPEKGPRQAPRPDFDHPHLLHHSFYRLRHDWSDSRRHVPSSAGAVRGVPVPVQVRLRDHARLARQAHRQHQPGLHSARSDATTRNLHDHSRGRPGPRAANLQTRPGRLLRRVPRDGGGSEAARGDQRSRKGVQEGLCVLDRRRRRRTRLGDVGSGSRDGFEGRRGRDRDCGTGQG